MFQKSIYATLFLLLNVIPIHAMEQPQTASIPKKSNYDQFVCLERVIYRDISNGTSVTNATSVQTSLRRLKETEKMIHKEVIMADPSGVLKPATSKSYGYFSRSTATPTVNSPAKIKNLQTRYSNEIFMFAENYRRGLEALNEIKFSDDILDLHVHSMLQDYHAFYQKLLDPGVINRLPELFSLLRRAKESEAEARKRITQLG
jgi:hypothetical protein